MARGVPDYYNSGSVIAQRMIDTTQLFAAMVGIPPLDGRGRILFFDTFSKGVLGYNKYAAGDGVAPVASSETAEVPPYCVKAVAGTLPGGGESGLNKSIFIPWSTSVGIEVSFALPDPYQIVSVTTVVYTPTIGYRAALRCSPETGSVDIVTSTGVVEITTINFIPSSYLFYPAKLVFNPQTGYFSRLIIAQREFNISQYVCPDVPSLYAGVATIDMLSQANGDDPSSMYWGHFCITVDEP